MKRSYLIILALVLGWFAFTEAATEGWYRFKESRAEATTPWKIRFPSADESPQAEQLDMRNYEVRELGETEQEILRFKESLAANWRDSLGNRWTAFMLEWDPDQKLGNIDILHNPTICLPAAGLKLVQELPEVKVVISSGNFEFKAWEFSMNRQPVFVYTAVRRSRLQKIQNYEKQRSSYLAGRAQSFQRAIDGNRSNPLESLQLVVAGPTNPTDAQAILLAEMATLNEFSERKSTEP